MEEKDVQSIASNIRLFELINQAKTGDKVAMQTLLDLFEVEMIELSKHIPMNQEDSLQSLRLHLIEFVLNGNITSP